VTTTIILIAHGFSTILDADLLVVLEDGRLSAMGTHEILMAAGGWYADAFVKQHHGVLSPAGYVAAG